MSATASNTGKMLVTVLAVVVAVILAFYVMTNPTGAIAGIGKILLVIGILIGIVNQKAALYFLAAYAIYVDHLKRLGVAFGVTSYQTVQEILLGPLATIAAMNLGFLYGVMMNRHRLDGIGKFLYLGAVVVLVAILLGGAGEGGGAILRIYNAGTIAAYLTLIPITYGIFKNLEEWCDLLDFMTLLAVPAAAWGFWQYFEGFSTMEWQYARTGLSPTHSNQMLGFESPRVFGWFGSESAYGVVGLFAAYCLIRVRVLDTKRWLFLPLTIFYCLCVIASQQRSILLLLPVYFVCGYLFRYRFSTIATYAAMAAGFILSVLNAGWMISEGLPAVNRMIASNSEWGRKVLFVSTFSDRLQGWERLGKAKSWTLFGSWSSLDKTGAAIRGTAEYNHDVINKVLIKFGGVGVFVLLIIGILLFLKAHRIVFSCSDRHMRLCGAAILGIMVPFIVLSFAGGGNFSTTPINMVGWVIFAGLFILNRQQQESSLTSFQETPTIPIPVSIGGLRRPGQPILATSKAGTL